MARLNIKETDCFEALACESLPIVLYGTGNGADAIIKKLNEYNIPIAGIFASDNFVRNRKFHNIKVLSYADICQKYDDFIIVLAFGTNDSIVLNNIRKYSKQHKLYAPDIPICGNNFFTKEFYNKNKAHFENVYSKLADTESRRIYENIINYKISGKVEYLFDSFANKHLIYSDILNLSDNETIVDIGAYCGDTIKEFTEYTGGKYNHIYALEPDSKNFLHLKKNTAGQKNITLYNIGAWSKKDELAFANFNSRNSHISDTGTVIKVQDIDSLISDKITFIKMDIEGAESHAIEGCSKTIKKYKPKLYICSYHKSEDLFAIPESILQIESSYKVYFRHSPYIPAWESNFYFVTE